MRDRCVDLVQIGDEVVLRLETGGTIITDLAILATPNDAKPALNGIPAVPPWTEDALKNLSAHLPVLIVGTGLTMVDMALLLDRRGHAGKDHGSVPAGTVVLGSSAGGPPLGPREGRSVGGRAFKG